MDKLEIYSKESAKPVVDSVKQVIKDRKSDSPSKLLALKLLNRCLSEGAGEEFLVYMEKKIMSRLAIFAKHKKVLTTPLIYSPDIFEFQYRNRMTSKEVLPCSASLAIRRHQQTS